VRHYDSLPEKLIIREKEGKRRQRFESILPLMTNAKKVITYHSMAVVEALCLGKRIEVLGQSAVQHWQGQFGFDRNEMLEHIAHSQFKRDEFASGLAWDITFKYQVENNV
jgi:predicted nuclease with RNAse H fold